MNPPNLPQVKFPSLQSETPANTNVTPGTTARISADFNNTFARVARSGLKSRSGATESNGRRMIFLLLDASDSSGRVFKKLFGEPIVQGIPLTLASTIHVQKFAVDRPIDRKTIQAFVGSMTGQGVTKGIFHHDQQLQRRAREFVQRGSQTKVVLIDGDDLLNLILTRRIGVRVEGKSKCWTSTRTTSAKTSSWARASSQDDRDRNRGTFMEDAVRDCDGDQRFPRNLVGRRPSGQRISRSHNRFRCSSQRDT